MQSVQESKQELEAAIRYAENAISAAQGTIESMEFRQEMAKQNYREQTGREEALTKQVQELNASVQFHVDREAGFLDQIKELESKVQGQYDDIVRLQRDVEFYSKEYNYLLKQKEASSGPCGCQAYRDLEEKVGDLESEVNALEQPERATMPVIPKAVAIAIFREGIQTGVLSVCSELEGQTIMVEESEYVRNFEVSFGKEIDLDDELDFDWLRGKCGDYSEDAVIDSLKGLCADKEFECRIHGIDDNENKNEND